VRYDDLMPLVEKGDFATYCYNEQQLVAAKMTVSDTGEPVIALQFSNGLTIEVTASKYGSEKFDSLKVKYFRKS
jgi:hypothetical protein